MATTTNFGWETPDDTDLVKDGAAAMRTLGNSIDTSFVDLKGGTTGQVLAKASNTDLDYTWTNGGDITAVTAGTGISGGGSSGDVTITNSMATAIDAKGDLVAGTGADAFARLAVGTNGQVLKADSTQATGLVWGAAGGMSAYSSWTPVIDQGATTNIATTGNQAYYATDGEFVHCYGTINLNGAGTASGIIGFSVPIAPNALMNQQAQIGTGGVYDASAGTMYPGLVYRYTASRFALTPSNATSSPSYLGNVQMTAALAAGDAVYFNFVYRS